MIAALQVSLISRDIVMKKLFLISIMLVCSVAFADNTPDIYQNKEQAECKVAMKCSVGDIEYIDRK